MQTKMYKVWWFHRYRNTEYPDRLVHKAKNIIFPAFPALCVKVFKVTLLRLFILFFLVPSLSLRGQISAEIRGLDVDIPGREINGNGISLEFSDTLNLERYLAGIIASLHSMAYLEASVDSLLHAPGGATAYIHTGLRYDVVDLSLEEIDPGVLQKLNIRARRYERRPVGIVTFRSLQERILNHYENNGYPFASVSLAATSIDRDTIRGMLTVERNGFYRIDSVHIYGDPRVEKQYLYRHIGISPGDPYSEKRFRQSGRLIRETGFLGEIREPEVEFMRDAADLYLYIDHRQSGMFSGIIGMVPSGSGSIRLAGEVNLELVNMFRRMEHIGFHWQSPGNRVQQLDIELGQPYLFGRAFGADLSLHMFRQDSAYLRVEAGAGIPLTIPGRGVFSVTGKTTSVSVIDGGSRLPGGVPAAAVNSRMMGLSYRYGKIDNHVNPYRGWSIRGSLGAGSKTVTPPRELPVSGTPGNSPLPGKSWFAEGSGEIRWFIPVSPGSTIMLSNMSAKKLNIRQEKEKDHFYAGELFLLGGIHTIRGFDERSIAASAYTIQRIEYRYLFDAAGNIFLFFDGMAYRARLPGGITTDTPFGFGTGLTLDTRAGQFTMSYALGREFGNPVSFRTSRVHMGLISRF